MSSKKGEGSKQPRKDDEKEGSEEGSDTDEGERMQSFLTEEANIVVRKKYRDLMDVIHQHADEQKNMDLHSLQLLVLEANEAFDAVKRPREAAIDAQLLKVCGSMAKHHIEVSQSSLAVFNPREFAEKLISFAMTEEENDLETDEEPCFLTRMSRKGSYLFKSVPGLQPFFSAVEWERPEPQRKGRVKKKDSEGMDRLEAQKVAVLRDPEAEEEAEAVSWMCKILKRCHAAAGNTPLPFFRFIVDPTSFSRTVENIFHASLLVREQYAEIVEDEDGLPVILPTQSTGIGEDKQCILSMDIGEWEELIKAFEITHSMIPPKGPSHRKRK